MMIALSVACGVALLLIVLKMVMAASNRKLESYVQAKFDKTEIIGATTRANFFGRRLKGGRQLRGNGALVLTRDQLFFVMAMPVREFAIPIKSINKLSLPKTFNGRSVLTSLLCVHYLGDDGEDAMAWALKDPGKWSEAIAATMKLAT